MWILNDKLTSICKRRGKKSDICISGLVENNIYTWDDVSYIQKVKMCQTDRQTDSSTSAAPATFSCSMPFLSFSSIAEYWMDWTWLKFAKCVGWRQRSTRKNKMVQQYVTIIAIDQFCWNPQCQKHLSIFIIFCDITTANSSDRTK